jgi:hypothetical protein
MPCRQSGSAQRHAVGWPRNGSFIAPDARLQDQNAAAQCCNDAVTKSPSTTRHTETTMTFRPKYITFDCYGTLTRMRMGDMAREMFADRIPAERMEQFLADFTAYRLDECLRVSGRLAAV